MFWRSKIRKIAITGSIASGKSYFLDIIKSQGFPVISADQIIREKLYIKYQKQIKQICETDDRAKIAAIIYKNSSKRRRLERLLHKNLALEIEALLKQNIFKKNKIIFIEMPLLFEKKSAYQYDYIVNIDITEYLRKKRAIKRGINMHFFKEISKIQFSNHKKRKLADYNISVANKRELNKLIANIRLS